MAPCYRNIASKPLELLGYPKVYMPIYIGDESQKQVIEWIMEKSYHLLNNGQSAAKLLLIYRRRFNDYRKTSIMMNRVE